MGKGKPVTIGVTQTCNKEKKKKRAFCFYNIILKHSLQKERKKNEVDSRIKFNPKFGVTSHITVRRVAS
jgi:hypothetical protein